MLNILSYILPLMLSISFIQSKVIKLDWKIEESTIAPDNSEIHGILINGHFPGPTVNAVQGDIVKVKVRNHLHKDFTIHWHGILQTGTSVSDGVPYVTQDPIKPGEIYDYYFELGHQSGTHWYHAHTGLDAEHAYGAFIIQDKPETIKSIVKYNPKYKYDEEHLLMVSEMWHASSEEMMFGLTGPEFKPIKSSDSILMNGQVYKNWTSGNANPNLPTNKGNLVINVKANKTYRIRIIGALGLQKMKFSIPNHKFTLIEADGTFLEPLEVDYVEIFGGQRYSVLLQTNQKPDNYICYVQRTGEKEISFVSKAILHYENAPDCKHMIKTELENPKPAGEFNRWMEDRMFTSKWYLQPKNKNQHYYPVPKKVNKNIYLLSTPQFTKDHVDELINNIKAPVRNTTLLTEVIQGTYKNSPGIYEINEGDSVQIIMEHYLDARFDECLQHPWHLHGHAFHVVGSGKDQYDSKVDDKKIDDYVKNTKNLPVFRDTFTHFPKNVTNLAKFYTPDYYKRLRKQVEYERTSRAKHGPTYCGWYAIRFIADNPGTWFMHCHISGHLVMGKSIMIVEKPKDHNAFVASYNANKLKASSA